jgi:hypothetical protein
MRQSRTVVVHQPDKDCSNQELPSADISDGHEGCDHIQTVDDCSSKIVCKVGVHALEIFTEAI